MTENELIAKIQMTFNQKHSSKPSITVVSPGRINLIGEHTDYNNGFVLPAAIDKSIICTSSKNKKTTCSVYAIDVDDYFEFDLRDIKKQEKGSWKNYVLGVIVEIQKQHKLIENFDLVFGGNIPSGSGLSSSAALENSIVFSINTLFNLGLNRRDMMLISQKAEHLFADVKCGIMDQFASMTGEDNHAILLDCQSLDYQKIPVKLGIYELLLINTNVKHELSDSAYNTRREECQKGVEILNNTYGNITSLRDTNTDQIESIRVQLSDNIYKRCIYVVQENIRVKQTIEAFQKNDIEAFGKCLFSTHDGLQNLYEVSCDELDFLVDKAKRSNDVIGSRMMGGGFGGCTINLIKKGKSDNFIAHIKDEYQNTFQLQLDACAVSIKKGTHKL